MRNFVLLLALVGIAAAPLHARLGETEEQIAKRYGEPVKKESDNLKEGAFKAFYEAHTYSIEVTFIDGLSALEYFKRDYEPKLTEEEITSLLQANCGSSKWVLKSNGNDVRDYVLEDGKAHASTSKNTFCVESIVWKEAFLQSIDKAKKENEALQKKLEEVGKLLKNPTQGF